MTTKPMNDPGGTLKIRRHGKVVTIEMNYTDDYEAIMVYDAVMGELHNDRVIKFVIEMTPDALFFDEGDDG